MTALLVVIPTRAQEMLEVEGPVPATIKLGGAARVQIRVEGRGANPQKPEIPAVAGLAMRLSAPTRSSYSFFDGRTLVERKGVQYQLTLRPERAGEFVVPPFTFWTGTRQQTTPELRLTVVKDLRGDDLGWIDIAVEPRRVYVHEPIRIGVQFGIERGLRIVQDVYQRTRYLDIEVQAQWLSNFPGGERIPSPEVEGDRRAIIANRELFLAEYDGAHERNGRRWQRFAFERAFLPTRTGTIELPAPTLRFHVVRSAGRPDVFRRSRGAQTEQMFVYGEPVRVEVLPIPEEGRPTPYYGAVGRFSIDAELDRNSVRRGDSVKLRLTVRGQGNLEFLRLPEVDALAGFHKLGQAEAQRDAEKVVVTYDLVPLSEDLEAVPPIEWNYFDTTPGVESFVEIATPALPLSVQPLPAGETLAPLPSTDSRPVTPGVDDVFDLPDLDGPPARVAERSVGLAWLATLGPWIVVALALAGFSALRRRRADVTGQRMRAAFKNCRATLAAGGEPVDALAAYVGDRLDVPAAAVVRPDLGTVLEQIGIAPELAAEVAAAIEQGTAARYGGGAGLDAATVERLVGRLEPTTIDARAWPKLLALVFLPLTLAMTGPLAAQSPVVSNAVGQADPASGSGAGGGDAAVAAYRAGDYERADELFAARYVTTGDRRLLQARGNCLYRRGELARALWAYESARLGLPRDSQLLQNIALVQRQLEVATPVGGFAAELDRLRGQLTPGERIGWLALCMFAAAGCLILGWRRVGWRWVGALFLMPGVWLAAETLWFDAERPVRAIAMTELAITSEPRAGLEPIARARAGVAVEVLGGLAGSFVRVAVENRSGYVPVGAIAVVE